MTWLPSELLELSAEQTRVGSGYQARALAATSTCTVSTFNPCLLHLCSIVPRTVQNPALEENRPLLGFERHDRLSTRCATRVDGDVCPRDRTTLTRQHRRTIAQGACVTPVRASMCEDVCFYGCPRLDLTFHKQQTPRMLVTLYSGLDCRWRNMRMSTSYLHNGD